jgi:glycine dehydrogenase subunit 1
MPYLYNTSEDQAAMLAAIGVRSLDDLFAIVPAELRLKRELAIPPALSEIELTQHMSALAARNEHALSKVCFLGGGSYDHFVPAVVDEIAGRGEFYTSYTPYQAEVSQGNLQVVFEYQTLLARLTGLDVSNASLYDGGSAAAEAVLMAACATDRYGRVIAAASVNPEYRQTIATYLRNLGVELVTVGTPTGVLQPQDLAAAVDRTTACVMVQQPNFFGCVEDAAALAKIAHDAGALVVAAFDPISLGLLKRPGDWGAYIAVA